MNRSRSRQLVVAFATVLSAANLYFINYASLQALYHPASHLRLNLYGDPQIEGDAKLKREPILGRYDLLVNDYYLRHVYMSTIAAFQPQYVVTMGDIFSSQRVRKAEYYKRIERFSWISGRNKTTYKPIHTRRAHAYMFLAGNHDIGYGAETRPYHINRYVNNFGPINRDWMVDFDNKRTRESVDGLHQFAILNAMNLDFTQNAEFRNETWSFLKRLVSKRAKHPAIPLTLFLHIPLSKPSGICVAEPEMIYKNGSVHYQDYLSPVTSAYLLHCLTPTLIFNGHDHNGCLSAHSVKHTTVQPVPLGDSGKLLQVSEDLCSLQLEELDMYQLAIEEFAAATVTSFAEPRIPEHAISLAVEVTVRSTMGEYSGATGIFDISPDSRSGLQQHIQTSDHGFVLNSKHGYIYRYREVLFGYHLIIRVLAVVDLVSVFAVPALLLALSFYI
ncbi:hypothetical protein H4S08_002178 [Coemansia sp. RSA 1365]|nr:hypothetical protein H4S08_002178 [Coemansia sp. RSA 1365]